MTDEPPPEVPPSLVALEYVVDDDAPLLELLCDRLGFSTIDRHPHPALDADVTLVDAGSVVITVLRRTARGDRPQIPPQQSALSQLVFDVDPAIYPRLQSELVEAGAPVIEAGADMFHLGAQLTQAVFGVAPTLVFHRAD